MKAEEFPLDQRGRNVDLSFVPTQGITTERIDETGATCVTSTLGTYAIIAEKIEPPVPYEVTLVGQKWWRTSYSFSLSGRGLVVHSQDGRIWNLHRPAPRLHSHNSGFMS